MQEQTIIRQYQLAITRKMQIRIAEFNLAMQISKQTVDSIIPCPVCKDMFHKTKTSGTTCKTCISTVLFTGVNINKLLRMYNSSHIMTLHLLDVMSFIDAYISNSKVQIGKNISCPVCNRLVDKKSYNKSFCSVKCKDKFWNTIITDRFHNAG